MQTLLEVILPVFLVIGFGYVAVWKFAFPQSGVDGMMKFAQSIAIPCLLFKAIAEIDLQSSFHFGLLFSFYTAAILCFTAGVIGARFVFKRDWEDCIAIGFCCFMSNTVLLGLPITERAYGPDSLIGNFAIIAIHSPFCYGIGITAMEITRNRGKSPALMARAVLRAMFRNPLVIGITCGFILNLSGLSLPKVADDALGLIIRAALPVALFSLGGILLQYKPEGDKYAIAFVCSISLLLHPALFWALGTSFAMPRDFFQSGVLTAAMATGINGYVFADLYGRAKRVAASSVLVATGASAFTVWIWLTVLG
jgi:predicted permease